MNIDPVFTEVEVNRLKANRPAWAETVTLDRDHVTGEVIAVIYEGPVNRIVAKDVTAAPVEETIVGVQASQPVYPDQGAGEVWISIIRPPGYPFTDMDLEDAMRLSDLIRRTVTHVTSNGGRANPIYDTVDEALSAMVSSLLESMGLSTEEAAHRMGYPSRTLERVLAGAKPWNIALTGDMAGVVGLPMSKLLQMAQENTITTVKEAI